MPSYFWYRTGRPASSLVDEYAIRIVASACDAAFLALTTLGLGQIALHPSASHPQVFSKDAPTYTLLSLPACHTAFRTSWNAHHIESLELAHPRRISYASCRSAQNSPFMDTRCLPASVTVKHEA
jgi:hypothetical protein